MQVIFYFSFIRFTTSFIIISYQLPNSLAHLLDDIVRTGYLLGFRCMDDIRAELLGSRDGFREFRLATWCECDITHTSIAIMCLTPHESDLLHREEESSDPTRCESDRLCEIHPSHTVTIGSRESIEDEEVWPSEPTEPSIEPAGEYCLDTREWDKKWECRRNSRHKNIFD